jgi:hypothetical protein
MKKILEKEKQRILELHHKTPMKSYLFEQYSWAGSSKGTGTIPVYNQLTGRAEDPNIAQTRGYGELQGKDDWWGQSEFDYNKSVDETGHLVLAGASVVFAVVGGGWVGALISGGIQLFDSAKYYQEGDSYMAGLTALFALIPGSSLVSKIPGLKKMSTPAIKQLSYKLSNFVKTGKKPVLDAVETEVMEQLGKNSDEVSRLLSQTANKAAQTTTNNTLKTTLSSLAKSGLSASKEIAKYGGAWMGYNTAYEYMQSETPSTLVAKENIDWNLAKSAFGSSGSYEENMKLQQAWKEGWRPGTVVPEKYRTKEYAEAYNEEQENLRKLDELIAKNK